MAETESKKLETVDAHKKRLRRTAPTLPNEVVTKAVSQMPERFRKVTKVKGATQWCKQCNANALAMFSFFVSDLQSCCSSRLRLGRGHSPMPVAARCSLKLLDPIKVLLSKQIILKKGEFLTPPRKKITLVLKTRCDLPSLIDPSRSCDSNCGRIAFFSYPPYPPISMLAESSQCFTKRSVFFLRGKPTQEHLKRVSTLSLGVRGKYQLHCYASYE